MRAATSRLATFLAAVLLIPVAACSANDPDPRSIAWVCTQERDHVQRLLASLDYSHPGMQAVGAAAQAKDYPRACNALIDYYRNAGTVAWLRMKAVPESNARDADADSLLSDNLTAYSMKGKIARTRAGGIDWNSLGPNNDPSWGDALNGMYSFDTLLHGYAKTGQRRYVARIDADLRDWVISNPMPHEMMRNGPWRGIDAASRIQNWMRAFYRLQSCDDFSRAARILMLSSLLDHADYLVHFHRPDDVNKRITEMSGLGTLGCAWPEFRDAGTWRSYSLDQMNTQMSAQVYPDGAQTELATIYHRVVTEAFDGLITVFRQFGYDVTPSLSDGVERMWSYLALCSRPDGTTPENNDSDRRDIFAKLNTAVDVHHRGDWTYITSHGASGTAPTQGPSVMFPWAGQLVMRNSWKPDAQWAFFDVGPAGTAHQHRDKLHLSIDAFGRALLVDAGRYTYSNDAWREYFTGSASHNVVLVGGRGQDYGDLRVKAPIAASEYRTGPGFDFARGTFDGGYPGAGGKTTHTRSVVYVKDRFWVVVDRIETDAPRDIDALWHFAPDCHVRADGSEVVSDDAGLGNLRIVPVGGPKWTTTLVAGRGEPDIQGWYSPDFGTKQPETCAVLHANIPGSTTFAWVLVPARGVVPKTSARVTTRDATRVVFQVQKSNDRMYTITVPLHEGQPDVKSSQE